MTLGEGVVPAEALPTPTAAWGGAPPSPSSSTITAPPPDMLALAVKKALKVGDMVRGAVARRLRVPSVKVGVRSVEWVGLEE